MSCSPANDASGESSLVADERTATGTSSIPDRRLSSEYACRSDFSTSGSIGIVRITSRMDPQRSVTMAMLLTSRP